MIKRIPREKIREEGSANRWPEPAARVQQGEPIWIETERYNASNGPVFVEGIQPGDTIVVTIEDIQPVGEGESSGGGPAIQGEKTIIPIVNKKAIFPEGVEIPIDPMIGVIGVLPEPTTEVMERVRNEDRGWREVLNAPPGKHGGNMDCRYIRIGSKLYLQAKLEGGMLGLADVHAVQGDGELSGTGVEVAADVKIKIEKSTQIHADWPIVDTGEEIMTVVTTRSYATAAKEAVRALVDVVSNLYGLSPTAASLLVCTAGHVKNCSIWMLNEGYLPGTEDKPAGDLTVAAAIGKLDT